METKKQTGYGYIVEYKRIDGRLLLGRITAPGIHQALENAIARFADVDKVLRVNRIPGIQVPITDQELLLVRQGVKTTQLL
jgi:hypothetical protein